MCFLYSKNIQIRMNGKEYKSISSTESEARLTEMMSLLETTDYKMVTTMRLTPQVLQLLLNYTEYRQIQPGPSFLASCSRANHRLPWLKNTSRC